MAWANGKSATSSSGGGGGSSVAFERETATQNSAFSGFSHALAQTGVIEDSIAINYRQKLLVHGVDYTYNSGSNSISVLVEDDPASYGLSSLSFLIQYAYTS